ncbi:hypothetical protein V1477_018183 [Vespula maculifrons]|uniref:Uncharacterized protein n=1 Tax=Vespula maculifrons TaxID=7453 RepID=A0ABD2AZ46_VESMC
MSYKHGLKFNTSPIMDIFTEIYIELNVPETRTLQIPIIFDTSQLIPEIRRKNIQSNMAKERHLSINARKYKFEKYKTRPRVKQRKTTIKYELFPKKTQIIVENYRRKVAKNISLYQTWITLSEG